MIDLLIRILLAIATHTACDIGKPADYYAWVDAHPDYTIEATMSIPDDSDYWLMSDSHHYYLFKFAQPIDDTIASGASHGECFREVGRVGS